MSWEDTVPSDLAVRAYNVAGESSWLRDDALKVVSWLTESGFDVVGVEVWLKGNGAPRMPAPFVYTWDADTVHGNRSSADQFIEKFRWEEEDTKNFAETPYFNITAVTRRSGLH